jgi:hypothetical protein
VFHSKATRKMYPLEGMPPQQNKPATTKNVKTKSPAMETVEVEVELVFGPENPDSESDAPSDSESTNKPNVPQEATTRPAAEAAKKPEKPVAPAPPKGTTRPAAEAVKKPEKTVSPAPPKATTRPAAEAAKKPEKPVAPAPPKATTPTAAKKKPEESTSMREEAYVPKGQGRQWKI